MIDTLIHRTAFTALILATCLFSPVHGKPTATLLVTGLEELQGSAIGPGGALFVTAPLAGSHLARRPEDRRGHALRQRVAGPHPGPVLHR